MNKKEAYSLLVSSLAITGGVLSASLTGGVTMVNPEILGEGLKAFGGLGGNLVANALQKHLIDSRPQDDVLKNGDLTRAIGKAIFELCRQLGEETSDKNDKSSLQKLSETPLEIWENLILGGGYEEGYGLSFSNIDLDEVSAEQSVKYLNAKSEDLDKIEALTPQTWQNVIHTLCQKQHNSLSKQAKEELAAKLHKEFARALRKVLIDDFSKDGKAYASMQFRLLGEVLSYLNQILLLSQQNYEQNDAVLALVISSNKKIEDLSAEVSKINKVAPNYYSPDNKAEWQKLFSDFDSFRVTLDKTNQNTEIIITIVTKILENQEKQTTSKQQSPKFYPKNFPSRLPYFTGREQVLANIAEALENHGTAAFADTHGVGKSSVVVEYAYRKQGNYGHILFIRATNNEFDIYVSEIVKELGFALPGDAKPEQRFEKLQEWLAKNRDWLLLIDNVDDVDFIHKCGFNKPGGKVIYTSNDERIFKVGTRINLPRLKDENAMLLLYKHWQDDADAEFEDIPEKARPALKGIAEKFGNHPFSMAFVGSYLAEEDESLDEFLEAYQAKEKNLLESYEFLSNYQHKSVATAFLLRFEQISTPKDDSERERFLSIAVQDYLKLSAFVATDNIPEELLQQSLAKLHPDQNEWTENTDFIKDIYKRFKPTGIFKRDADNKTLTTHRIVQEVMRSQIKDEEDTLLETLAEVLGNNFELFNFLNKENVERYLLTVNTFLDYLEQNKTSDSLNFKLENYSTAILSNNIAKYFRLYEALEKSEKFYKISNKIFEKVENIDQTIIIASHNNLGTIYRTQNRFDDAESLYKKALALSIKILGENESLTAMCYWNLAKLYEMKKKYDEAEYLYQKALIIFKVKFGQYHQITANVYNDLGGLYYKKNKLVLANKFQLKSLNVLLENFDENHPHIATSYWWLGKIAFQKKDYMQALNYFKKAIGINLNYYDKEHHTIQKLQNDIDECERLLNN